MAQDGDDPNPLPVYSPFTGFRCPECGSPVQHSPHPWIDLNGLSMDEVCYGVPLAVVIGPIQAALEAWIEHRPNGLFEAWGPVDGHPLGHVHDQVRLRAFVLPVSAFEVVVEEDDDPGDDAA